MVPNHARPAPKNPNLKPHTVAVMITAPTKMPATLRPARRRSGMAASVQDWNPALRSSRRSNPLESLAFSARPGVVDKTGFASRVAGRDPSADRQTRVPRQSGASTP